MRLYGKIELIDGSYWRITTEPQVVVRFKRIFEQISKHQHGVLTLTSTPTNDLDLQWALERYPMEMSAADRAVLDGKAQTRRDNMEAIAQIVAGNYQPKQYPLVYPPRNYQQIAIDLTIKTGALLVADGVGLGKTVCAIGAITEPISQPALVVTLTHLQTQWEREFKKFAPTMRVHILKSGTPYDLTKKKQGRKEIDEPFPDVIITNYHKLSGWSDVLAPQIKGLYFDEVQELRHPGTGKYCGARHLRSHAQICGAYSATPIYNYGSEIYHIVEVVKPGELGSYDEFKREWCDDHVYSKGKEHAVRDPKALGAFLREQGLMLRRTRKDVGRELPPVMKMIQEVEWDDKPFQDIQSDVAELCKVILAQDGKGIDKMQASAEFDLKLRRATGLAKAKAVAAAVDMLCEQGEKVVLFGWHHAVYDVWMSLLKHRKPVKYTGEQTVSQKDAALKAFIEGDSEVFIISLRAGAGIDGLQNISHISVFGELDYSPAVMEQNIGRQDRDGQVESVLAIFMYVDAGSDPVISDILGLKRDQSDGLLDPDGALIEQLDLGGVDRVKRLAAAYLKQHKITLPITG